MSGIEELSEEMEKFYDTYPKPVMIYDPEITVHPVEDAYRNFKAPIDKKIPMKAST